MQTYHTTLSAQNQKALSSFQFHHARVPHEQFHALIVYLQASNGNQVWNAGWIPKYPSNHLFLYPCIYRLPLIYLPFREGHIPPEKKNHPWQSCQSIQYWTPGPWFVPVIGDRPVAVAGSYERILWRPSRAPWLPSTPIVLPSAILLFSFPTSTPAISCHAILPAYLLLQLKHRWLAIA